MTIWSTLGIRGSKNEKHQSLKKQATAPPKGVCRPVRSMPGLSLFSRSKILRDELPTSARSTFGLSITGGDGDGDSGVASVASFSFLK